MSVPPEVKQQEAEIVSELRKLGIQAYFKINRVDPKTKAWDHTITFSKVFTKEDYDKIIEVIRRHHEKYTRHNY